MRRANCSWASAALWISAGSEVGSASAADASDAALVGKVDGVNANGVSPLMIVGVCSACIVLWLPEAVSGRRQVANN
jgi:hypothetical protein